MANDTEVCGNRGMVNASQSSWTAAKYEIRIMLIVVILILLVLLIFGSWQMRNILVRQKREDAALIKRQADIAMMEQDARTRHTAEDLLSWRFHAIRAFEMLMYNPNDAAQSMADMKAHADVCSGYKHSDEWTDLSNATDDLDNMWIAHQALSISGAPYGRKYLINFEKASKKFHEDIHYGIGTPKGH